ncbi:MAG: helix-turn-helix domain-containing protein [Candidatus Nanopelagicales bacterium]
MSGVPELIKDARTSAGLTQQELARRAQTAQSLIARYESGSVSPTVRALSKLLAGCGQQLQLSTAADPETRYTVKPPSKASAPQGVSDYLNRPPSGWSPSAGR